ncbi:MAG: GntR family transcriptional regulator [Limnochordaceae bacterium]|nr:GntR family transcriptional regulator [Limnochordaceae bacterium]
MAASKKDPPRTHTARRAGVDRMAPVPLYLQVRRWVEEEIERRHLGHHARVPSERELARRLSISRMTVRAALEGMIRDNVLYRVPGKGTFVAGARLPQHLRSLTSFTEDMRARGLEPGARVLGFHRVPAPAMVAERLRLAPAGPVLRLERLRLAGGEPMCIETAHLSAERFGWLADLDMTDRSLYALLREHRVQLAWAEQSISARDATPEEASLLLIRPGSAVLVTERTTFAQDGSPVEYVVSTYRADRYTFQVVLPAEGTGKGG